MEKECVQVFVRCDTKETAPERGIFILYGFIEGMKITLYLFVKKKFHLLVNSMIYLLRNLKYFDFLLIIPLNNK